MDTDPTKRGDSQARVPARALLISIFALAVPVLGQLYFPDPSADLDILLWLLAMIPAFLFAYHRGWRGAAGALSSGIALLAMTQLIVVLSGRVYDNWPLLLAVVVAYMSAALAVGWVSELLHRERRRAEGLAMVDELTNLPNRRFARRFIEIEVAAAQRGRRLALVMIDIDHFKRFNDRYGHVAGDRAIVAMSRALSENTRRMDLASRWGGEEFVVVLSDSDADGALRFLERVRESLEAAPVEGEPLTFSAGVAVPGTDTRTPDELIEAADRAMFQAKGEGRNRVVVGEKEAMVQGS